MVVWKTPFRLIFSIILTVGPATVALGQIVTDGTTGRAASLAGPDFAITADLGRHVGVNLFHSFDQFHIGAGESATFSGPDSVRRVISRVTGGTRSTIDGLLRASMPEADLYLINPAGLLFGPRAELDINGSFWAASADHIDFTDGNRFSATDPGGGSFTIAAPQSFGFLDGPAPNGITVNSASLDLRDGRGLSLLGGRLSMKSAFLEAPGGDIRLTGVGPGTSVALEAAGSETLGGSIDIEGGALLAPSTETQSGSVRIAAGTVEIRSGSRFPRARVRSDTQTAADGGTVAVSADTLVIEHAFLTANSHGTGNAGEVDVSVSGRFLLDGNVDPTEAVDSQGRAGLDARSVRSATGNAGSVRVHADRFDIIDRGRIRATAEGRGDGGTIRITGGRLSMTTGARIETSTFGSGDVGTIIVDVDQLTLSGGAVINEINGVNSATGGGGRIDITAGTIRLDQNGRILTDVLGPGNAGPLSVNADHIVIDGANAEFNPFSNFADSGPYVGIGCRALAGGGNCGPVSVHAKVIELPSGGLIESSGFGGINRPFQGGDASTVTVTADERLILGGGPFNTTNNGRTIHQSQIRSKISSNALGRAGEIIIKAGDLIIKDAGLINNGTAGFEDGGPITITADTVSIDGQFAADIVDSGRAMEGNIFSGIVTESVLVECCDRRFTNDATVPGNAGSIAITANTITLRRGGTITSSSGTNSNAGVVEIAASSVSLIDGGSITVAASGAGDAGSIAITAGVLNIAKGSVVSASTVDSGGGSIAITARDVVVTDQGRIASSSTGTGFAGDIVVQASEKLRLLGGRITAEAAEGNGGNITITVGDLVELNKAAITTTVASNVGNGGNIDIDPIFIVLVDSRIIANASTGAGGAIQLTADNILADSQSVISASSDLGIDGTVAIDAPDTDLTGGLTTLATEFLNATALLAQQCADRGGQAVASLTAAGRGGLPNGPNQYQTAHYFIGPQGGVTNRPTDFTRSIERTFAGMTEPDKRRGRSFRVLSLRCET